MKPGTILLTSVSVIVLAVVTLSTATIVDTGHRGVKVVLGKVQPYSLEEGFYLNNPLTSSIKEMDVRTLKYSIQSEAYTKDVQQATMQMAVNYNLEKTKAHEMYENVGIDWAERFIPQAVEGAVKAVIGKWDATDLIGRQDEARAAIEARLVEALRSRDILVTRVDVADTSFKDAFENAVEAKVVAIQTAEQEKNKTVQVQEQAKQTMLSAEAAAKSMAIRAQALSANANLVEYEAVNVQGEAVKKWNGVLPQYMLGGATPFVNVPLNK